MKKDVSSLSRFQATQTHACRQAGKIMAFNVTVRLNADGDDYERNEHQRQTEKRTKRALTHTQQKTREREDEFITVERRESRMSYARAGVRA